VAVPELSVWAAQPEIETPPISKLTVPVAPVVTTALSVTDVPAFCGEAGEALSVVVELVVASFAVMDAEFTDP
jgi:hypothetical protein